MQKLKSLADTKSSTVLDNRGDPDRGNRHSADQTVIKILFILYCSRGSNSSSYILYEPAASQPTYLRILLRIALALPALSSTDLAIQAGLTRPKAMIGGVSSKGRQPAISWQLPKTVAAAAPLQTATAAVAAATPNELSTAGTQRRGGERGETTSLLAHVSAGQVAKSLAIWRQ